MTTNARQHGWLIAAAAATFLVACSGGSSGGAHAPPGRTTVRGAVRGFAGGLQVNGVAFRTAGASLSLPDASPTPIVLGSEDAVKQHLDDGMVVTVQGTLDAGGATGQAAEIEFRDQLEGMIDAHGPGRLRVLGAEVSIDGGTAVTDDAGHPRSAADLLDGHRVEVSGWADGRGGLRATFARLRDDVPAATPSEVKGYVISISGAILDLAFAAGGTVALHVDLSGIASPPPIAVGDLVEVKTMGPPDANGNLLAVAIELETGLAPEQGAELEVEGIVDAVTTAGFTVAGQLVIPNPDARFEGGTPDDVVVGAEVEAEGVLGDDGALHASEVKVEASVRIDGNLDARDPAAQTLTILGITAHATPSTELRGFAALADLAAGDHLEVRGSPRADGGGIDATRIELLSTSPADRAFLRAVVTAATPPTGLTMMGLAIDAHAATFKGPNDAAMDAAAFFGAIVPGRTLVKVRWRPYPASPAAPIDEAELED